MRKTPKQIRKKSQQQEARTAKEFGGKEQIASGALYFAKADVRTGADRTSSFNDSDFLIENKFTDKPFYKLEKKIWDKIAKEALKDNMRLPMMQVDIQDTSLVILTLGDFVELLNGYEIQGVHADISKKSYTINQVDLEHISDKVIYVPFEEKGNRFTHLVIIDKHLFLNR